MDFQGIQLTSTPVLLAIVAGAGLVWYIISAVTAWHGLRQFQGPFLAKFSYLWLLTSGRSGRNCEILTDTHRKYGSLTRIGPYDLLTDDPELIRNMSAARSSYKRSSWYMANRLDLHHDSLFTTMDTVKHDKLKAKVMIGYSGKQNSDLEPGIDEQIVTLVQLLKAKYISKSGSLKPLDMARLSQYLTLDIITRIAFGKEFGYLKREEDIHDYIKITEGWAPTIRLCAEVPFMQKVFMSPFLMQYLGPKPTDPKGMGKLLGLAQEIVATRFGSKGEEQDDMLGGFVKQGLTARQCENEVLFQIIAGSDTTATSIRATMLYLMTSPHAYHRLRQEIDDAIAQGRASNPITDEEGRSLPYLQAVIYEGLRIHPPFAGLLMKEVPAGGDTLEGRFVPAGTRIAHSTWAALHNRRVFGEDADLFRPERWLGLEKAERLDMERIVELIFGYGRWGCAGKQIAFMELNKVFFELLRDLDFQLINPLKPWTSINHQLFINHDMFVHVTERKHS
ncbi:cytochrome P450 [Nemania sp. NC0429]|nr:cytochrome P450 [Nemania sp. NC0429]